MKFRLTVFHNRSFYNFILDTLEANGYAVNPADKGQMGYFGQEYATLYMNTADKSVKVLHGNYGFPSRKAVEKRWGESLDSYKRIKTTFNIVEVENLDKKRYHRRDVGHVVYVHGIEGYDLQFFTYGKYIHIWQGQYSFKELGFSPTMLGAIEGIQAIHRKQAEADKKREWEKLLATSSN